SGPLDRPALPSGGRRSFSLNNPRPPSGSAASPISSGASFFPPAFCCWCRSGRISPRGGVRPPPLGQRPEQIGVRYGPTPPASALRRFGNGPPRAISARRAVPTASDGISGPRPDGGPASSAGPRSRSAEPELATDRQTVGDHRLLGHAQADGGRVVDRVGWSV